MAFSWSRRAAVLLLGLVELGQQFLGVAVVVGDGVRVLDVEVVAAGLHLLGGDLPGDFGVSSRPLRFAPPHQSTQACRCSTRIGLVIE